MKSSILTFLGFFLGLGIYVRAQAPNSLINDSTSTLREVKVLANPGQVDQAHYLHREVLTVKTLAKAACCNLSESFETNASVSVNFTDAITGSKQIQLLGLSGIYVQQQMENMPYIRGLKTVFGLNYTPGTWVQSIDLAKGQSSVVNGYESITGGINVELVKPDTADRYYSNTYVNSQGRWEINQQLTHRWKKLSTAVLAHASSQAARLDRNGDGFMDLPLYTQYNVLNRWKYQSERWMAQWGIQALSELRLAGQMSAEKNNRRLFYGFGQDTRRWDAFGKLARLFPEKPYKGWGLILNAYGHDANAFFGGRDYRGKEQAFYLNWIYQSIFGNTNHQWKAGFSYWNDRFEESYLNLRFDRQESVPGAFFEYTYLMPDQLTLVLGQRLDFHNLLGTQWVPRMHLKWDLAEAWVFRASAGKGWRYVQPLADNFGFLANQRGFVWNQSGKPMDKAWNFGASLVHDFFIGERKANLVLDVYHTNFMQQWLWDMESRYSIRLYQGQGKSFANSAQVELNYSPIKRLEIKAAYRYQQVEADYSTPNGLRRLSKAFVNRDRLLLNIAYATPYEKWKFDYTWQWNGKRRIPNMEHNFELSNNPSQAQVMAPAFGISYAQVSRKFKKWDAYVGVENALDFTQKDPIMSADKPFDRHFDATMVWGPVIGRMVYLGTRWKIN